MFNGELWKPTVADSSLTCPDAGTELRRRSFPAHTIQSQQKEASVMVDGMDDAHLPPPYEEGSGPTQLSFIQRHFYRPPSTKTNDGTDPKSRRFSFLSRGSLVCSALLLLMVSVIVLCAVLATYYEHRHKHEKELRNAPVKQAIFENFPDPAIFHHNGTWYAYATNNAAGILRQPQNASSYEYGTSNVQIATSIDFIHWDLLDSAHDPLPRLGAWVNPAFTDSTPSIPRANVWAPEILQRPSDGKFVMFYSALVVNVSRAHCVGAAVSDDGPTGPFTPLNDTLACPTDVGGAIDPVSFVDVDDSIYLAWKIDGNNHGHGGVCGNTVPPLVDTPIRLMKMQADGITPDGSPITIMDRIESDGPLIEAPSIIRSDDGVYFLFFSSGCTRNPSYDIKYAWSHSVTGPYTRAEQPLLKTGSWDLLAPGSIGIRRSDTGQVKMVFHARVNSAAGEIRAMYIAQLALNGTVVTIARFDDSM